MVVIERFSRELAVFAGSGDNLHDEFSSTVAEELGWSVPLFVYLEWERDGAHPPPPEALDAARKVALHNPIGSRSASISRRRFLGGVVGFSALAATGFPARTQPLAAPFDMGGSGRKWRLSRSS